MAALTRVIIVGAGLALLALVGNPFAASSPPPVTLTPPAQSDRISFLAQQHARLAMPKGGQRSIASVLNVTKPMHYGEFVWDEDGVPAGPVWVRVDLARQLISAFRGEHEIGSAVILYGADGLATPTGTFPVLAKLKDHRSATYNDAPMPYTLRLTTDGVAIHGSDVREGAATHGCIGVPTAFAAKLFDVIAKGDPVAILPAA